MRRFEAIQLAVVALAVLWPVLTGFRFKRSRAGMALAAALVLQLVVEGYRWQLLPLEVTTLGLAIGDLGWDDRRVRGFPRFRRGVLGSVGLAALAVAPIAFPIPELPRPSGAFAIGTANFLLTDPERVEQYGRPPLPEGEPEPDNSEEEAASTEPRGIVVQAWYPTPVAPDAEPLAWNPDFDVVVPALSDRLGFPEFLMAHTAEVASHSYPGAPPFSGRLPVVLYSHGWTGFRTIALNQIESLASQGYLVLAADHTYGAIATRFPTGEVVLLDSAALPDRAEVGDEDYFAAAELLEETFSGDLSLILDGLEQGVEGSFGELAAHADLSRVGIFGHSIGAGAAVWTCLVDPRCDAVLGMDAWVEPIPDRVLAGELQIPSMFLRSEEWQSRPNDRRLRGLAERSPSASWWIGIDGTAHSDFVITPLLTPLAARLNLKGPIPADQIIPIIDGYLVAFFDRYVLGVGGARLQAAPPDAVDVELLP